jgi:hypothetical protein
VSAIQACCTIRLCLTFLLRVCHYTLSGSCRVEPGRAQRCFFFFYFLHDTFDLYVISNQFPDRFTCGQNWPLNSPDLNPCDYFLWGFLKEEIFPKKPQTVMDLRALIIQAWNKRTEDMCCRVINNITDCVEVARRNGGHI